MNRFLMGLSLATFLGSSTLVAASPLLELSTNAGFGGGADHTVALPMTSLSGVAWNGFTLGLGSLPASGTNGLYLSVQGASTPTSSLFVRFTGATVPGLASTDGHSFSIRFERFAPPAGVPSPAPGGPGSAVNPVIEPARPTPPPFSSGLDPKPTPSLGDGHAGGSDPSPAPVPEPASLLLLGSGLAAAAVAARRRRVVVEGN